MENNQRKKKNECELTQDEPDFELMHIRSAKRVITKKR